MSEAKLQRAHQHIEEAATLVSAYLSSNPIRLVVKPSECGQWDVVYVDAVQSYAPAIPCVIGNALYNLRSFLDHSMMQIVLSRCDPACYQPQSVYFPIRQSQKDFQNWVRTDSIAKQLPHEVLEALTRFSPYEGGSVELSALHKLNNVDKHRNLLLSAMNYESAQMLSIMDKEMIAEISSPKVGNTGAGKQLLDMMGSLWIRDKNCEKPVSVGQKITRYRSERTANSPVIKFEFSVFEESVPVRPIVAFLRDIEREVRSVGSALAGFA